MSTGDRDVVRRMEAAAAELRRRVATVHERHPCPCCGMPVGVRCIRANAAARVRRDPELAPLASPHWERLELDGLNRR